MLVALEVLEVVDAASDELLENVVDCFLGTNPILSKSLGWSKFCVEGFRNRPLIEARGFKGRAERVLLPALIFGRTVPLTGLGDLRTDAEKLGDGSLETSGGAML